MRDHLRSVLWALLVGGIFVGGCNIFGTEDRPANADMNALEEELDAFLQPWSRQTIPSDVLLTIAKEARESASIGALGTTWELSQWEVHSAPRFPFEEMLPGQREAAAVHIRAVDRALALLLFANAVATGTPPSAGTGEDAWLRIAAERVVLVGGVEPCDFYPDFIVARLLRVMLDFRLQLDRIGATFRIVGTQKGYGVRWMGSMPMDRQTAASLNDAIAWLEMAVNAEVLPMFNPYGVFGCPTPGSEIIDLTKVRTYAEQTLLASLHAYVVNTGEPGNPGVGDDDGDGRIDEEMVNGLDEDGDGLVDEDAHL